MKRKIFYGVLACFVLVGSGCKIFKKKNKCVSCPTWDAIEDPEAKIQAVEFR